MSEPTGMPTPPTPDTIVAQVTIILNAAGQIQVNGPIDNRLLMYGMLSVAQDVVRDRAHESEKRIVQAPAGVMHLLDSRKGS